MRSHLFPYISYILAPGFFLLFGAEAKAQDSTQVTDSSIVSEAPVIGADSVSQTGRTDSIEYFDAISGTPAAVIRKIPDSIVTQLKQSDDYWYADKAPVRKKADDAQTSRSSKHLPAWLNSLLWILIVVAFCGTLIWYLVTGNASLFRKANKPVDDIKANEIEESRDIFSINFETEISKALAQQDLRSVVRLRYLQTLKNLSLAGLIRYRKERTDSDYLFDMYGKTYYSAFQKLTHSFEYIWYGQGHLTVETFRRLEEDFSSFNSKLSS